MQTGSLNFLRYLVNSGALKRNQQLPEREYSHYVWLKSIDEARNRQRVYSLTIRASLQKGSPFSITKTWGRIGGAFQSKSQEFDDRDDALADVDKILSARCSHDYVISEISEGFPPVPSLGRLKNSNENEIQLRFDIC
jgi:predicted DNA-binding WGR domain protein